MIETINRFFQTSCQLHNVAETGINPSIFTLSNRRKVCDCKLIYSGVWTCPYAFPIFSNSKSGLCGLQEPNLWKDEGPGEHRISPERHNFQNKQSRWPSQHVNWRRSIALTGLQSKFKHACKRSERGVTGATNLLPAVHGWDIINMPDVMWSELALRLHLWFELSLTHLGQNLRF